MLTTRYLFCRALLVFAQFSLFISFGKSIYETNTSIILFPVESN